MIFLRDSFCSDIFILSAAEEEDILSEMIETEHIDLIGLLLMTIDLLEDKFDYLSKK